VPPFWQTVCPLVLSFYHPILANSILYFLLLGPNLRYALQHGHQNPSHDMNTWHIEQYFVLSLYHVELQRFDALYFWHVFFWQMLVIYSLLLMYSYNHNGINNFHIFCIGDCNNNLYSLHRLLRLFYHNYFPLSFLLVT
jgi:hypothetical protein